MKELLAFQNLIHGFSQKYFGNMSFNWGEHEEVLEGRKKFLAELNIDMANCVSTQLEDSNNISIIGKEHSGLRMFDKNKTIIGDGLITKEKGLFLFIAVADCLPCIILDTKQEIVGIFHLSWKSTEAKLCHKAMELFLTQLKSNIDDIRVAIGPGIHKETFAFRDPIQKQLPGWEDFLTDLPNGETSIDLVGYNVSQIESFGVNKNNIYISEINTAKDDRFFSHFRDSRDENQPEGRFAAIVGFKS